MWLLLFVLGYRTFVQVDLRPFSMMIVLWFSYNFDTVVEGGEHSVYLLCHLDWQPT